MSWPGTTHSVLPLSECFLCVGGPIVRSVLHYFNYFILFRIVFPDFEGSSLETSRWMRLPTCSDSRALLGWSLEPLGDGAGRSEQNGGFDMAKWCKMQQVRSHHCGIGLSWNVAMEVVESWPNSWQSFQDPAPELILTRRVASCCCLDSATIGWGGLFAGELQLFIERNRQGVLQIAGDLASHESEAFDNVTSSYIHVTSCYHNLRRFKQKHHNFHI